MRYVFWNVLAPRVAKFVNKEYKKRAGRAVLSAYLVKFRSQAHHSDRQT